ncbi:MAG TPA: lipocalin-like domain-containing protein [Bacteroidia bacterium]|nr:lipocalin-like domain-containing protein [Bacteroidia bacterium]
MQQHETLVQQLAGVWWLQSREDYTAEGVKLIDPVLGADPIGILAYSGTHFTAQFMRRDRSGKAELPVAFKGSNNTQAAAGYDAYFGTYRIDAQTGKVEHTLLGSVTPENIGMAVWRDLTVVDETLTIRLATHAVTGEAITRTLTFSRLK